jgi:DNA-binding NtrC family response regulator
MVRHGERPDVAGRRQDHKHGVLVVEDEPLILLQLRQMLEELGWHVTHVASDIERAMELARSEQFDVGILDVNIRGRTSLPVAEILHERHVPIILATGYSTEMIAEEYPQITYLQKPYVRRDLANAITRALGGDVEKTRMRA